MRAASRACLPLASLPFVVPTHARTCTRRKDALRSLIVSQQILGTREIALFHHTGCSMTSCSTPDVRARVRASVPGPGAAVVDGMDFLEFGDLEGSVKEDVAWLKAHPLILRETVVTGWLYDVDTGAVSSRGCTAVRWINALTRT
jgi:carbonic anhydrase